MRCLAAGNGSEWDKIWDPRESVSLSVHYSIDKGLILLLGGNEYVFLIPEVAEICALD